MDAESGSAGFAGDIPDDLEQAGYSFLLTHKRRRAGGKCLPTCCRIVLKRKNDHPCGRLGDGKPNSGADAIEAVHPQVKHHHIRVELACQAYRHFPFPGLADDVEVWFAGHAHAQALANAVFVINE